MCYINVALKFKEYFHFFKVKKIEESALTQFFEDGTKEIPSLVQGMR